MRSAIARVLRSTGDSKAIVGAGCACGERLVLTCAHVIGYALGARCAPQDAPEEEVLVDFPFAREPRPLTARVIAWVPAVTGGGGDLAVLQVFDPLPSGVDVPPLGGVRPLDAVGALGFPAGEGQGDRGQWAYATARDPRADGWVQIEEVGTTGYWIQPGFSGTPAWKEGRHVAVGIVAAVDLGPQRRVAFMIPMPQAVAAVSAAAPSDATLASLAARFQRDRRASSVRFARDYLGSHLQRPTPSAVRELADRLEPGEPLVHLLVAAVMGTDESYGLLGATDRRLVFVYKIPLLPAFVREFPYQRLNRVTYRHGMGRAFLDSGLHIDGRDHRLHLGVLLPTSRVPDFVNYVSARQAFFRDEIPHLVAIPAVVNSPTESARGADAASDRNLVERKISTGQRALALAFHPDGRMLAVGARCRVRLWDVTSAESRLEVSVCGQTESVRALAFSGDGRRLVTGADNKSAQVWEVATGDEHLTVHHTKKVRAVAFSPDCALLATGGDDGMACVWDVTTGKLQKRLEHAKGRIPLVLFLPAGDSLLTGHQDGALRVWDLATGRPLRTIQHPAEVRAGVLLPPQSDVFVGYSDGSVITWDTKSATPRWNTRQDKSVEAVAASLAGRWVASGSGKEVRFRNPETGDPTGSVVLTSRITSLAPAPDGQMLAIGCKVTDVLLVPAPAMA